MKPLLFEISEDEEERWGFHYFRDRTSGQIISFSDHEFWNRLVIQAGYSRTVVRHALVAIGSYHESVDHPDEVRRLNRQQFAFQQYNEAIKAIARSGTNLDTEDVLLTVILFVFLENVRGSWSAALVHLNGGLRILSEWRAARQLSESNSKSSNAIEEHLAPILDQLQTSAASLMPVVPKKKKVYSTYLPDRFVSLQDAHFYYYELVHAICARLHSGQERTSWPYTDEDVISEGRQLLLSWYSLFEKYLCETRRRHCSCSGSRSTCHFEIGSYHLQIHYWAAMIRLECKLFRSEMIFDDHLPKFLTLLGLVGGLIRQLNTKEAAGACTCLGINTNYLSVTAFIALRCRDPGLRRAAIDLMRSQPRTEGKWNNEVAADVAEFIMVQEEAAATVPRPSSCRDIPDRARLQMLACSFFSYDKQKRKFEMLVGHSDITDSVLTPDCRSYDFGRPELIKIRVIRSGINPADQVLETLCLDRRLERSIDIQKTPLPDDVSGFFPQTIETESKLWGILGGKKVAEFLERASASHICGTARGIRGVHQLNDSTVSMRSKRPLPTGELATAEDFSEYIAPDVDITPT